MPWEIRIDAIVKSQLRAKLASDEVQRQFDGQTREGTSDAARAMMLEQFQLASRMVAVAADLLPGPKVGAIIKGHSNGALNEALPAGSMGERITIDIYQVRFLTDG